MNKNMILLIGIILLWFLMIKPLNKNKTNNESNNSNSTVVKDSITFKNEYGRSYSN